MKTANEQILDLLIMHQLDLVRFSKRLGRQYVGELHNTNEDLIALITKFVLGIIESGPRGPKARKKYKTLLDEITNLRAAAWTVVTDGIIDELTELPSTELDVTNKIITDTLPVNVQFALPPLNALNAIVTGVPYQGGTCIEQLASAAVNDAVRITKAVKRGLVAGSPLQAILKDVKKKTAVADRNIETIVRTVASGIANTARSEFYAANSDIFDKELYVATLDFRTTPICALLDGQVFKLNDGPIPPLHYNCRSLRVPYINPENLRNRGFDSSTTKRLLREFAKEYNIPIVTTYKNLPRGYKTKYTKWAQKRKRELVGQVPAVLTFTEWFKNQTVEFQNEYLGVRKAKMYRSGVTLEQLTGDDGVLLTIDQLRSRGLEVPSLAA